MKTIATLGITTLIVAALPAQAALPFGLGFEGMQVQGENGVYGEVLVDDFYAGGSSKNPATNLPAVQGGTANNFGVTFDSGAQALRSINQGQGNGNFGPRFLDSQDGPVIPGLGVAAMLLTTEGGSILNIPDGFSTALSFYFASEPRLTVTLFDDVDGTGNQVASEDFLGTGLCTREDNSFCIWSAGAIGFQGTARSVRLGGLANQTYYDNVTFGSRTPMDGGGGTPAPEPGSFALAALGLLGVGAAVRRRQRPG